MTTKSDLERAEDIAIKAEKRSRQDDTDTTDDYNQLAKDIATALKEERERVIAGCREVVRKAIGGKFTEQEMEKHDPKDAQSARMSNVLYDACLNALDRYAKSLTGE